MLFFNFCAPNFAGKPIPIQYQALKIDFFCDFSTNLSKREEKSNIISNQIIINWKLVSLTIIKYQSIYCSIQLYLIRIHYFNPSF